MTKPEHRDNPVPKNPQTHKPTVHPKGEFVAGNECTEAEDLPSKVY